MSEIINDKKVTLEQLNIINRVTILTFVVDMLGGLCYV